MIPVFIPRYWIKTMPQQHDLTHPLRETMFCVDAELCQLGSSDVLTCSRRCLEAIAVHAIAANQTDGATAEHLGRSVQGVVEVAVASGRIAMLDCLVELAQVTHGLAAAVRTLASRGSVA
jgi:hypothetical protein